MTMRLLITNTPVWLLPIVIRPTTLVNTVEPKLGTQRGMGQIPTVVENAFNHPVMKTSKIVLKAKGSGKITKPQKVSKVSKIRYV